MTSKKALKWAEFRNEQGELTSYYRKEEDDIQDILVDEKYVSSGMVGAEVQRMIKKALDCVSDDPIGRGLLRLSLYEVRKTLAYLEAYDELVHQDQ